MSAYSRVLATGKNQITCDNASHCKNGGKPAVDIVKSAHSIDNIIAHSDGKVVLVQTGQKNNKGSTGIKSYGNVVKIDHGSGIETLYAHLDSVAVKKGQNVRKGDIIGKMGNTGNSYGAHLHWEVRKNNVRIDPTPYLNSELPIDPIPDVFYQVHANGKWLPIVKNLEDYAGISNKSIDGIKAYVSRGHIKYRAHTINGRWLPWVTDTTDYAGIYGQKIDMVQMQLVGLNGYDIFYQVSASGNGDYYPWVKNYSSVGKGGYAGAKGKAIDLMRIYIEKR